MQKIPSLFVRNYESDRLVRDEIIPGCEWVVAGEGVATRKWDGTCCMIRGGVFYKRYEVKKGGEPPIGFEPACDVDPVTGKQQGWLEVGDGPEDKWHREATKDWLEDGTYELIGPKINGNAEGSDCHRLVRHGDVVLLDFPRTYQSIKERFSVAPNIEGVVFHHPDGRMAKVKLSDFGIRRDAIK